MSPFYIYANLINRLLMNYSTNGDVMSTTINQVIADVQSAKIGGAKVAISGAVTLPVANVDPLTGISVSCYINDVPDFVGEGLEKLYQNFYSSLSHLRKDRKFLNASTYVERIDEKLISLILFERKAEIVTVLNEVIAISDIELERFSHYIFGRFGDVTVIQLRAVAAEMTQVTFPFQRQNYLEDIVIDLPDSTESYLAGLGKNLRRNLRRCRSKLEKSNPSFSFDISENDAVKVQAVRDVVALNRARMLGKDKVPAIDDMEAERLAAQVREGGLVCVGTINGKVCAGAICFRTGNNYFLTVIAHDSMYDVYSMGILCCAQMICECIDRGAEEFHFLWGRYDYKFALNGVQRDLYQVAIYRSKLHFLRHIPLAIPLWWRAKIRQITLRLQELKRTDGVLPRLAFQLIKTIRRI
jgi:hypothetical protein